MISPANLKKEHDSYNKKKSDHLENIATSMKERCEEQKDDILNIINKNLKEESHAVYFKDKWVLNLRIKSAWKYAYCDMMDEGAIKNIIQKTLISWMVDAGWDVVEQTTRKLALNEGKSQITLLQQDKGCNTFATYEYTFAIRPGTPDTPDTPGP